MASCKPVTLWRPDGRQVVVDVLGRGSDPDGGGDHSCHVIVLPGNPSVLPFYSEFVMRIADGLDSVVVQAVGHAGFGFDDHNDGEKFDLEDQIAVKILYLDQLLAQMPIRRFVLIGHSVGAFMAMEIVKRRPDLPVDNAVLLFPAICHLRVAWPIHIMMQPIVYEPLALLVSYLPDRCKAWLASAIPQIRHEAAMVSAHCNAHTGVRCFVAP